MIGIYKITSPSGRIYIGQSNNIEKRFKGYKNYDTSKQPRLHRSFNKYGIENHIFEVVCECELTDLDFFEQYYIFEFDTFNTEHGLNLRDGGKSFLYSDEVKAKMSKTHTGKVMSAEARLKMSIAATGRVRAQWEKDKISVGHKGKIKSPEHQANLRASLKKSSVVQAKMKMMQAKCCKKVKNIKTGTVYDSATEAAKVEGFLKQTLVNRLNGSRKNNTNLRYL